MDLTILLLTGNIFSDLLNLKFIFPPATILLENLSIITKLESSDILLFSEKNIDLFNENSICPISFAFNFDLFIKLFSWSRRPFTLFTLAEVS